MKLYLRLLWLVLVGRRRAPVSVLGPCRTPFRVAPTDLDLLRHVNNGVYLSVLDVARLDLIARCGLAPRLRARGWYPVVAAETITFRRSLRLFERFEVETVILGWDEKAFYARQQFLRGPEVVADAVVRARFLARTGGPVTPSQVLGLLEATPEPVGIPAWVRRWSADSAVRPPGPHADADGGDGASGDGASGDGDGGGDGGGGPGRVEQSRRTPPQPPASGTATGQGAGHGAETGTGTGRAAP